jgi:hypothetical protein
MLCVPTSEVVVRTRGNDSDLAPDIRSALTALEEVELRYEADRECLQGWCGPEAAKTRLLNLLEVRHKQEREPFVQRLAELYQHSTMASMFRSLHRADAG